eukprot:gene18505-21066_t
MENNSVVVLSVTVIVVIASFILYKQMSSGDNTSSGSKDDKKSDKSGSKSDVKKDTQDKYPAGKVTIYFGSQTGTAEGFARTLMEEGKSAGFNAKMIDLEDFSPDVLKETERAIFLMATYGEGEPTDNAISFTKWMKNLEKELGPDTLNKLKYSVFGLGNKQYEHYNLMGKLTNSSLEELGATRMFEYGEGDDDATLEEDFDAWRAQLWPALTAAFHPDAAVVEEVANRARLGSMDTHSKIKLDFRAVKTDLKSITGTAAAAAVDPHTVHASTRHFFTAPRAKIVVNRELRSTAEKSAAEAGSTRHIEIDLKGVNLHYHTADNLAILPENSTDNVAALAKAQGYDLDYTFVVQKAPNNEDEDFQISFPSPCTVREALTLYYDIQGPVKQALLKHLIPYVTDAEQLAWLNNVLHKDNRALLKALSEEHGKNLVDLLTNELSSCKIPLSDILHIVPFIQPRYYTISSSSSVHPDNVHVTISITEFEFKNGKNFTGLTSGYVTSDCINARVFVRPSSFRLPAQLSTPIVMIGPGTGLAPMRALLQERKFQQAAQKPATAPKNVLFFGCKHRNVDYIYRDELEAYQKEGVLTSYYTAFSRDTKNKVYVQNLMTQPDTAKELLSLLIDQGAYVYVCGATAMGTDVMAAFVKIFQEQNNMSAAQATAFVKELQDKGRYVQELWTA